MIGKCGKLSGGLAMAALLMLGVTGAMAQAPETGQGMGPHRPPMERAMGSHGDHGRWWNAPSTIEKLKLTETQRKSMDEIYQQSRVTLVDLHASLDKEELALEPLIRADQPEEGKILSQIDRVAQARAELEKANARMLLGLRRQLTPEQWKQVEAERAAHREAHGGMHEMGKKWHGPNGDGPGAGGDGPVGPGMEE